MSAPHHPLPQFIADTPQAEVIDVLHGICQQTGELVTVSEFSAYCPAQGKRSFLISFETDRDAVRFAQAHSLTVFGHSGVLVVVN